MPTFGFSAFLKLLSLNPKPQRRELRERLLPSTGGYDFHRSLRLRAHRYLVLGEDIEDLIRSADEVVNPAEQRSLKAGLRQLAAWREANPGEAIQFQPALFESPRGLFKVSFLPNFGQVLDGRATAIHIWNTGRPDLAPNMVYAALSLLPLAYAASAPEDFGVLSLPDRRLFRLSDVGDYSLAGDRVVNALEDLFMRVIEDLRLPPATHPDDRPSG